MMLFQITQSLRTHACVHTHMHTRTEILITLPHSHPLCWGEVLFLIRMCYILHMYSLSQEMEGWKLDPFGKER